MKTALLISFMLFGLCYSCPIPGDCTNLTDSRTYVRTLLDISTALNTTVSISPVNVKFRFTDVESDLRSYPHPNVLQENCTEPANQRFSPYNASRCPWYYVCDYNPQRIPPFIYHAKCNSTALIDLGNNDLRRCTEVYTMFFYLLTESCDPLAASGTKWKAHSTNIPVACTDVPLF